MDSGVRGDSDIPGKGFGLSWGFKLWWGGIRAFMARDSGFRGGRILSFGGSGFCGAGGGAGAELGWAGLGWGLG